MKLFVNASIPTSSSALKRVNILFEEQILKITPNPIELEEPCEEIDLKGKIVLPGAVDAHCHIAQSLDPAADIAQISRNALLGGWTTLAELSYFSPSPIYDKRDLEHFAKTADEASYVSMPVWGNIEIEHYPYYVENAMELWAKGALGLTLFAPSPNDTLTGLSFTEIMDIFLDIYQSDISFVFQGWDEEAHQVPSYDAQLDALRKILRRMQENPLHIPRVSSWMMIEFINTISKRSDISFSLNINDLMSLYTEGFEMPRRHELWENKDPLFDLIRTNKIYMVSHNASPAQEDTDLIFDVDDPHNVSFSYLWMLSEMWKKRKVPLATVVKLSSENAAKRLGIYPQKGCLDVGADADFVIYDPLANTSASFADGKTVELTGSFESVWQKGIKTVENGTVLERKGGFLMRSATPKRRHNRISWI